jgi:hypothetical protein
MLMSQITPISFIVSHKQTIETIHSQCEGNIRKTWENLTEILPELNEVMKFNTFKQYLTVLMSVTDALNQGVETDTIGSDPRLDKVRQNNGNSDSVRQKLDKSSKRILGWNIRRANDGYYRCYRKVKNKLHSIYIGKELDLSKAQQRIKEKEVKLGLDKS